MCRECSAVERGEGEVRGCKRGRVCVCVEGGGVDGHGREGHQSRLGDTQ